ncbi:potassium voltage-gated channel Shaw-like, partial [Paramuricea clavata]
IIAMLSMLLIIASVITSCLETMEYFSESQSTQHQVIHILEIICVIWFTAEILIRFTVCPNKRKFIKQIMNWLDFAAIIPFYLQLFLTNTEMNSIVALRIIRLIRVFRVFKLSRHSYSLQILGHTLRSSLSELFLLGFFLSIGVVVFSTLMFYAEHESGAKKFSSIPAGFWWAVVTMTTLGYGDIVPETLPGKLVGTACAICGVLTIALPIPVIVSNFSLYYSHAKAKQKASQRKRPLVIGAANALKVIDPFVGSRTTNLRLSGMSENASYMSPSSRVRTWPKIALDMAGSSFDSSEPPGSPNRRRLSRLPDKFWQFDQARNFDNNMKQCISSKYINETSAQISEDYCRGSEDFTIIVPERPHDMSTMSSEIRNRLSITSYTQDEPCQDLAKCFDPSETKKCNGAYENEAIEQNSENENTPRTMSGSNNEDETMEKAISSPALSGQGFSGKNLPGRMGRRGSVFVVGFLGKRWQAKAAKSRKNQLLQVSPTISSRGSSPNDESCRTRNQASPEPSSFRRSSCPTLPTLNISEDKMDLNLATNGCTGHNEDENSAKYCDTNDIVLPELDTKDSDVLPKHNRVDTNHCEVNAKHNEFETKGNKFQTKHDVDFKRNRVDTNHHEADAKKLEGEKGSPEMNEEVGNKSDMMLNDSSLRAEFDRTVQRSSSPLMRQKAFMLWKTFDYHGKSGKPSESETGGLDSVKTKRSTITLVEIETTFKSKQDVQMKEIISETIQDEPKTKSVADNQTTKILAVEITRMNGISPRDQGSINDLHFDDTCHIDKTNKRIGCMNNYAQNDGKYKPTDQPIQNNRDSTDVRKNLAYRGGQYHSLTSSMSSSQGSADQSKSFEYAINSANQYYEKSRSYMLEIRDETPV